MVTYQLADWIKASVHLRERFMGSGPLRSSRLVKLCPQYLYPASKSQNITIFWIKKMFWKQKNRIYVKIILFCVYIIVLESCNLAACVALEFCSEFLQAWFFSSIFRRYCALKGGALKCKYVPKRNSCAYSFFGKCLPAMLPM